MASARTFNVGPRALLAGDGGLLTAAALAVLARLGSLTGPFGGLLIAAAVLAPLLAWRLHGRHVDRPATEGALLGYLAGVGLLLVLFGLIAVLIALPLSALGRSGPDWILPVIIAVVYLVAAARLDRDALRDLQATRREHVWLDVARLMATVVGVATMVGVTVWATGHPEFDYTGAFLAFAGAGVMGAAVVSVADWMVRRHGQQSHAHLISGV